MGQFKLKANKIIQMHGIEPTGEKNMTDEKALIILKKCPAHIKSFSNYPANWQSLVAGYNPIPLKATPDQPKSEFIIPEVEVKVIDEVIPANPKDNLELMSKKELLNICIDKNLPEKEYRYLGKSDLINYILSKV